MTIKVARDFSDYPYDLGPDAGNRFRDTILTKALAEADHVVVDLDDSYGYTTDFIRDAFAGLITKGVLTLDDVPNRLTIKADQAPIYRYEAMEGMREAANSMSASA